VNLKKDTKTDGTGYQENTIDNAFESRIVLYLLAVDSIFMACLLNLIYILKCLVEMVARN